MNQENILETVTTKARSLAEAVRKHIFVLCVVLFVALYGYLLLQINQLNNAQPSDSEISQSLSTVKRPRIDQNAADKMSQLEDQNIQVKSLFEQARNNPFQE